MPDIKPYQMPRLTKQEREQKFHEWMGSLRPGQFCSLGVFEAWLNAQGVYSTREVVYPLIRQAMRMNWLQRQHPGVYFRTEVPL